MFFLAVYSHILRSTLLLQQTIQRDMSLSRVFCRAFSIANSLNYKVAIVGSGPAGFYTAHHLLHKANGLDISVDFFDRLPAPYGLSRYGVAPDHPEVKNCEEYMDNLMVEYPKQVRFFGNVNVGRDVSLIQLKDHYDSIVLAYGCTGSDNKLGIPGEELPGVVLARQFVNWYNSHPDGQNGPKNIPPPLEKIENVTVIGNGNVAIDVARVLLADPNNHWAPTDISTAAVELLSKSNVKRVNIVARRGLLESAFTNKEIRELLLLSTELNVQFLPISSHILDPVRLIAKTLGRVDKRKFAILDKACSASPTIDPQTKTWSLEFLKSPREFIVNPDDPLLLSETVFEENELVEDNLTKRVSVKPTGKYTSIKNELVITSIGYKGVELEGFDTVGITFDQKKNCLANRDGRLLKTETTDPDHNFGYNKGWYTSGWIKHGPRGVIATTMMESFDTADKVLEDLSNGIHNEPVSSEDIMSVLPLGYVDWSGWKKINNAEIAQGKEMNKTRNKIADIDSMVSVSK